MRTNVRIPAEARRQRPRKRLRAWLLALITTALVAFWAPASASAGSTPVPCDTGALIAALDDANVSGGGTLDLASGCLYTLTEPDNSTPSGANGLPVISAPITIHGNGAAIVRRPSAESFRIFEIRFGASLILDDLTLGYGSAGNGGAINNHTGASLTLVRTLVSNNVASLYGGGVYSAGSVVFSETRLSGNTAFTGGGLYAKGSATLSLTTLSKNHASVFGGGLFVAGGSTASVLQTTLSENSAGSHGGGVFVSGTATITQSTLTGNTAVTGGGLTNNGVTRVALSTLAGNTATGVGGGIATFGPDLRTTVAQSTISGNEAVSGGGIYVSLTLMAVQTIVANNPQGGNCYGFAGQVTDGGYNLDSSTDCGFTEQSSLSNTDPLLAPLGPNGGPTDTMALDPNSPAIDAGPTVCPVTVDGQKVHVDQRGAPRPQGPACDIGSYEAA